MNEVFMFCKRCIMHTGIPSVVIDDKGECNYCKLHDKWDTEYSLKTGTEKLYIILDKMLRDNRRNIYDCVIGISGGADSSYLLDYIVEYGLNPLAVHFDNNWNTYIAEDNIRKICQGLDVDLYRIGVNKKEYDSLCKAFLYASTPDADIPNDIALATSLYRGADKFDLKYILNGHSFRTEGTTPLGWTYMDGRYIIDVNSRYGNIPLDTYPNLNYQLFKKYIRKGIKRIRPIWYLDYNKTKAIRYLENKFDWTWYKHHHYENIYTTFISSYLWADKFKVDIRYIEYSALVRSGFIKRTDAIKIVDTPLDIDYNLILKVRERLKINIEEWKYIMKMPIRSYRDFSNYQERFKADKAFFKQALLDGNIPVTFYKKYVEGVI